MNEKTNASVAARPTPSAPALRVEAAMATDQGDRRAEEVALEHAGEDIQAVHEVAGVLPVGERIDVEDLRADDRAADDPHEVAHQGQERDQQDARQEPRDDQVVDRVGPQRREGVDLLGHAHRPQLGGHAEPTRPASIVAASTGPSSLTIEILITEPSRVASPIIANW